MTRADHILDIYGVHLHAANRKKDWLSICEDVPGLLKSWHVNGGLTHITTIGKLNTPHVSIWVKAKGHISQPLLIDTYAHESTHAALMILKQLEVDHEAGSSESLAYLTGWITGWLYQELGEKINA